jgi:hypothetical protein
MGSVFRTAEPAQGKISAIGLIPNPPMSIEEMQSYIQAERLKWGTLVKQLGLEGSQ